MRLPVSNHQEAPIRRLASGGDPGRLPGGLVIRHRTRPLAADRRDLDTRRPGTQPTVSRTRPRCDTASQVLRCEACTLQFPPSSTPESIRATVVQTVHDDQRLDHIGLHRSERSTRSGDRHDRWLVAAPPDRAIHTGSPRR